MDIVEFLRLRLAEDEQAAVLMERYYPSPWEVHDRGWMAHVDSEGPNFWDVTRLEQWAGRLRGTPPLGNIIDHVARHDPARALREVEAKRRIIDRYERATRIPASEVSSHTRGQDDGYREACLDDIRHLAAVYSDHPAYAPAWRPL